MFDQAQQERVKRTPKNHILLGLEPSPETYIGLSLVHIEAFTTNQDANGLTSIDVLCVYEDGQVYCFDEALTFQKWKARIPAAHDGKQKSQDFRILHVSSIGVQQATETILKNREDVRNTLEASTNSRGSHLLLLLTRSTLASSQGKLALHLLYVKNAGVSVSEDSLLDGGRLEELASLTIPEPNHVQGNETCFRLHASSGTLYEGTPGNLMIYDLTSITPSLTQTMSFPGVKHVPSYVRVSSDYIATSSENSVFLIDSKYSSFQALYDLTGSKKPWPSASIGKKTKASRSGPANVQILSYHNPSGSALVLSGRNLMAVDLSKSTTRKLLSRKRKETGLLIDAVGRSSLCVEEQRPPRKRMKTLPRALGHLINPGEEAEEWATTQKALDAFLGKGDNLAFDRIVASTFGDANTPLGYDMNLPEYKLDYLLSKIFSSRSTDTWKDGQICSELHIASLPEQTWNLLLQKGLVSSDRVEAALKRRELMNGNGVLKEGALIQALADWDSTLTTLLSLLQSPCLIKILEVCHALKITIAKYAALTAPGGRMLLSDGEEPIASDSKPTDQTEIANAGSEAGSPRILSPGDRFHVLLDTITSRCDACPASLVTKALKVHLSRSEIRNVVDLLRMKLAQGDWLSPYTENGHTLDAQRQYNNNQISMIGKLLNCAVDSLGTGGWLLSNSAADDSTEVMETVSYMKAEISAALEGIEEATYLQGMLGEVLLCGKSALNAQSTRPPPPAIDWADAGSIPLPLGLKLEQNIPLVKVGAGGELQRRSRRDIGKLKSRRVPKYSFERIMI
ncbi:MAG: hypothetical protein Q9179_000186 [Wetmoreana sp. 5 TL-2023]